MRFDAIPPGVVSSFRLRAGKYMVRTARVPPGVASSFRLRAAKYMVMLEYHLVLREASGCVRLNIWSC